MKMLCSDCIMDFFILIPDLVCCFISFFFCAYSNASDALDKLRYLSVTDSELLKDGPQLDIRIQTDKDNGIITIT